MYKYIIIVLYFVVISYPAKAVVIDGYFTGYIGANASPNYYSSNSYSGSQDPNVPPPPLEAGTQFTGVFSYDADLITNLMTDGNSSWYSTTGGSDWLQLSLTIDGQKYDMPDIHTYEQYLDIYDGPTEDRFRVSTRWTFEYYDETTDLTHQYEHWLQIGFIAEDFLSSSGLIQSFTVDDMTGTQQISGYNFSHYVYDSTGTFSEMEYLLRNYPSMSTGRRLELTSFSASPVSVPEPTTLALFLSGLIGIRFIRKRR